MSEHFWNVLHKICVAFCTFTEILVSVSTGCKNRQQKQRCFDIQL